MTVEIDEKVARELHLDEAANADEVREAAARPEATLVTDAAGAAAGIWMPAYVVIPELP